MHVGLANRIFKKTMVSSAFSKKNQRTKKVPIFGFLGFLIFDFNDPELVKIYSLVFPFSFSIKLSLLTFTLWIISGLANHS
jgi:hypothetical protein